MFDIPVDKIRQLIQVVEGAADHPVQQASKSSVNETVNEIKEWLKVARKQASDDYVVLTSPYSPDCEHLNASYVNIGRNHWGYCDECKRKWNWGSNILSSWRNETEEDWKRNEEFLQGYTLA